MKTPEEILKDAPTHTEVIRAKVLTDSMHENLIALNVCRETCANISAASVYWEGAKREFEYLADVLGYKVEKNAGS